MTLTLLGVGSLFGSTTSSGVDTGEESTVADFSHPSSITGFGVTETSVSLAGSAATFGLGLSAKVGVGISPVVSGCHSSIGHTKIRSFTDSGRSLSLKISS